MKNSKTSELIEALKEYNKTLADQIKRMKSFIDEIDKQLSQHKKLKESGIEQKRIDNCFSRDFLMERSQKHLN